MWQGVGSEEAAGATPVGRGQELPHAKQTHYVVNLSLFSRAGDASVKPSKKGQRCHTSRGEEEKLW